MKVSEIRELIPLMDVFELKPDARYLVRVPDSMEYEQLKHLAESLRVSGLKTIVMVGDKIKFFSLEDDTVQAPGRCLK